MRKVGGCGCLCGCLCGSLCGCLCGRLCGYLYTCVCLCMCIFLVLFVCDSFLSSVLLCHLLTWCRCGDGYYGDLRLGCRRCPCPSADVSHAQSCQMAANQVICQCRHGYTGFSIA